MIKIQVYGETMSEVVQNVGELSTALKSAGSTPVTNSIQSLAEIVSVQELLDLLQAKIPDMEVMLQPRNAGETQPEATEAAPPAAPKKKGRRKKKAAAKSTDEVEVEEAPEAQTKDTDPQQLFDTAVSILLPIHQSGAEGAAQIKQLLADFQVQKFSQIPLEKAAELHLRAVELAGCELAG